MSEVIEIVQSGLFAAAVADELLASIEEAVADRGRCSVVMAGGRTPGTIYRTLSYPPRVDEVQWEKVTVYQDDERWVPADHVQNNFRMIDETLLSRLSSARPQVYAIDTSLPNPAASAKAYADLIRENEGVAIGADPVFDIVLLGIGTDGHTASVFPNSPIIGVSGEIAAAVQGPGGAEDMRVTLTPTALFSARKIIFIVNGAHKADVIKLVLEGDNDPKEIPARGYLAARERVSFFISSDAAKKLERKAE